MKFRRLVKGLVIVIPVLAITACSTTGHNSNTTSNSSAQDYSESGYKTTDALLKELKQTNTIYFDFDKYDIKSDFANVLDQHAKLLRDNPSMSIVIEGHADERGTPEYNIALGERRANAVKMYLQGRGVSGNQIAIVSYGKEKPQVLGHNDSAYSKNRRAVIVY